jgi:hypothetical protein
MVAAGGHESLVQAREVAVIARQADLPRSNGVDELTGIVFARQPGVGLNLYVVRGAAATESIAGAENLSPCRFALLPTRSILKSASTLP